MLNGFQAMLVGDKTAEQQAADLEAAWDEGMPDKRGDAVVVTRFRARATCSPAPDFTNSRGDAESQAMTRDDRSSAGRFR